MGYRIHICSSMEQCCSGISALGFGEKDLYFSLLHWLCCLQGWCHVFIFSSFLLTSMAGILPLLKHIYTEVLLPHAMRLMASAVSCMGSLWSWLEWIVSGTGQSLSSCQKNHPCSPPLTTSSWTETPTPSWLTLCLLHAILLSADVTAVSFLENVGILQETVSF